MSNNDIDYIYIPLGYDCSTASALKELGLRKYSLPFDWVQTNSINIVSCINDNFNGFHQNIKKIKGVKGDRIMDRYGIQYPHDYPTIDISSNIYDDKCVYTENIICSNYEDYKSNVLEKYKRRILRFYDLMNDRKRPIILLLRHLYKNALSIKNVMERKFKRNNIYLVVATPERLNPYQYLNVDRKIILINPEINGEWNESTIWQKGIDEIKKRI
jgi:hypothetical protein